MKAKATAEPSQWRALWGLTKYSFKASLRNRAGWFFSLLFPIMFVVIFGLFSNANTPIRLAVADSVARSNPIYKTLQEIASQSDTPITLATGSAADLEQKLSQSNEDGVLESTGKADSVKLITSNGNPQGAAASQSFLNGIISSMNLGAAKAISPGFEPPFSAISSEISGKTYRYIDFALPGQIGFSLLSLSTFGVAFSFITLRKTLVLKRIFATSVKPITFVLAQGLSRTVQGAMQTVIILGVGYFAFKFSLAHGWETFFELLVLSFLGIIAFLGFGILIANITKDEQSAPVALNLFNFPQLFLSGTFFPTTSLPVWLQKIGNNLPLSFLNDAMRKIATDGKSLTDVGPQILGLVVWSAIAYYLAARTFKSE